MKRFVATNRVAKLRADTFGTSPARERFHGPGAPHIHQAAVSHPARTPTHVRPGNRLGRDALAFGRTRDWHRPPQRGAERPADELKARATQIPRRHELSPPGRAPLLVLRRPQTEAALLRWPQLTLKPIYHSVGFQRIGAVALKALKGSLSLAVGRERQNQRCPAVGASRLFSLSHELDSTCPCQTMLEYLQAPIVPLGELRGSAPVPNTPEQHPPSGTARVLIEWNHQAAEQPVKEQWFCSPRHAWHCCRRAAWRRGDRPGARLPGGTGRNEPPTEAALHRRM